MKNAAGTCTARVSSSAFAVLEQDASQCSWNVGREQSEFQSVFKVLIYALNLRILIFQKCQKLE